MTQEQLEGPTVTLADVEAARERIAGKVHRTPLVSSHTLGRRLGLTGPAWLKAENLQRTGSFKARGALNKIATLSPEERARGVITVSAGNHAQGVAWAAAAAGVSATVVMAEIASPTKVAATRSYGAEVILHGENNIQAFAEMYRLQAERGLTLVHPFDDPLTVTGQGTIGLEILEDLPDLGLGTGSRRDTVVVPIGGGGLIAGIALAIKAQRPGVRIIGVEPEGAPTMHAALAAGAPVPLENISTVADGLTAPSVGVLNLALVREYAEEVVLLTDEAILDGLRFLLERAKLVIEPAGAAAVAALLSGAVKVEPDAKVVALISGGNIDLTRLKGYL